VKFCGRGPQLLLRDPSAGRADNKPNADQIKWNRLGDTSVPVSADQVISSVGPHGRALFVHDQSTGARTHRVELVAPASPNGAVAATATDLAELIWVGGVIYALPPDSSTALWDLVSSAAPVVVSTQADNQLALATARITVPTSAGIGVIDGNDGTVADELPVSSASTAAAVYSAGAGFLVVSQSGIIAYR
jgi:hypothetical protein